MIIRTYSCLNRRCTYQFDSTENHPPCPRCGGLRVQWVPGKFGIRTAGTVKADNAARQLADDFGLTNFNSPRRGEPAMPKHAAPPPPQNGSGISYEPQKGWRVQLPEQVLQTGSSYCAPTGMTSKVTVDPNAGKLSQTNWGTDRLAANTRIEASHKGRIR